MVYKHLEVTMEIALRWHIFVYVGEWVLVSRMILKTIGEQDYFYLE